MHYNFHTGEELVTENYLPNKVPVQVLITSGASCPDAIVENVIRRLAGFFANSKAVEELVKEFESPLSSA